MEGFLIRRRDLILPGCGDTSTLTREETLAARWLHEPHLISNQPVGFEFPHPAGRYRPGGSPFSSPGCWSCRNMEGFLIRRRDLILPGCGDTSTLTREETLAARWLHEPQSISNHPEGLGFPHPAGRYRPGGSPFSSPGCWSRRDMDGFLIRRRDSILPGCGGTSLSRGATLGAGWGHEPQKISKQLVGWGFYTEWGGIDQGVLRFHPRVV